MGKRHVPALCSAARQALLRVTQRGVLRVAEALACAATRCPADVLRGGKLSAKQSKQLDWTKRLNMVSRRGCENSPMRTAGCFSWEPAPIAHQGHAAKAELGSGWLPPRHALRARLSCWPDGTCSLTLPRLGIAATRLQALDASKGMLYLHQHSPPIIHRDLKSPNLVRLAAAPARSWLFC